MAVAAQAALLDELMGKGRNVAIGNLTLPHWSDEEICKHFLAGLCPHDLFTNTKDDLGLCDKVHDQLMLDTYKKSKRFFKMKYEENLCVYLNELITSVENRIKRGHNRLKRNGSLVHSNYNSEREEKLEELNCKINSTLSKVEKLGIEGKVGESQTLLELAENLKNEKVRLEREIEIYNLQAKELEVCLTCGAFQVKGDAQQRIEEHLQGKMHIGYAHIRQYLSDFVTNYDNAKLVAEPLVKKRSISRDNKDKSKKSSVQKDDRRHVKDHRGKLKTHKSKERYDNEIKHRKINHESDKYNSKRKKEMKSVKHHRRK